MADGFGLPNIPGSWDEAKAKVKEAAGDAWDSITDAAEAGVTAVQEVAEDLGLTSDKDDARKQFFIDQFFLSENIDTLSNINLRQLTPGGYKNFTCLTEQPWKVVNELKGRKELESLFEITPAQQAYLVPKIRIFKVGCGADGKKTMVEFPFKTNLDQASVEMLYKSQAAGANAGIESIQIDWKSGGTTPVGVGSELEVSMTIYARTIGDLLYREDIDGQTISISDLVNRSLNPQIRLVVGWADPKNYPSDVFSPELKEAIRRARVALDCGLISTNISFGNDGRVTVNCTLLGRIEGIQKIKTADILSQFPTSITQKQQDIEDVKAENAYGRLKGLRAARESNLLNRNAEADRLRRNGAGVDEVNNALGEFDEAISKLDQQINNIEETGQAKEPANLKEAGDEVKELEKNFLTEKYNSILTRIITGGHMLYLDVPYATIGSGAAGFDLTDKQFLGPYLSPSFEQAIDAIEGRPIPLPLAPPRPDGYHRISYFYLGSLFDIVYDLARENEQRGFDNDSIIRRREKEREKFKVKKDQDNPAIPAASKCSDEDRLLDILVPIMGPLVIKSKADPPAQPVMINIADIPIAVSAYKAWFNKEVIAPGPVKNLSLRQFTQSVMKKLVYRALARDSKEEKRIGGIGDFRLERLQTVSAKNNESRINLGGRYNSAETIKTTEFVDPETPEALYKKYFLHDLMYFDDPDAASYIAGAIGRDEREDAARGIYYMKLGRDRGLVKDISFSRTSDTTFEAAKIVNQNDKIKLVPDVYDATVEMYGNAIFEPGMRIIIDPNLPGMGSVLSENSAALQLGLGGLYVVNNMIMTVSPGGFSTQLITSQQSPIGPGAKQIQKTPAPIAQVAETTGPRTEAEREEKLRELSKARSTNQAEIPEGKTSLEAPPKSGDRE